MFDLSADFNLIFHTNPQPLLIFKTDTMRFINVNEAACQQYGYTRNEFLQLGLKDLRQGNNAAAEIQTIHANFAHTQVKKCHYKHKKKDGSLIDVEIMSYNILVEGKPARLAITVDITEQVNNKLRLEQALNKIAHTLESISDGYFALSHTGTVVSWNKSAEGLTGIAREDIINKNFWDAVPDALKSGFYSHVEASIANQTTHKFEEYFPKLEKWFYASIYPSFDDVTIYFQDITELKKHQYELRLKNKRLEDVAYFNSHELRRPVANIIGLYHLLHQLPKDEKENVIEKIQQSCMEIDRVIKRIDHIQFTDKE